MQDLSYAGTNPTFIFQSISFEVQLFTYENVYALDPERLERTESGNALTIRADGLTWAGGQMKSAGNVHITAYVDNSRVRFAIRAEHEGGIRSVKLILKDMPLGTIANLREGRELEIPEEGVSLKYPEGWRIMSTPLIVLNEGGQLRFYRSLDCEPGQKKFVLFRRGERLDVELLYEADATTDCAVLVVPEWEVGQTPSIPAVYEEQQAYVAQCYGLAEWDNRPDVPDWAREIALVASIHGQHWTGYIHNDYAAMLRALEWLAERIEGHRILAYLPGWEGRYYFDYGDYRLDPRMGGEEGFRRLCDGARSLGVKLMPMFGINAANRNLPQFEQWGEPSRMLSAGGLKREGSCDWDGSRHYDHGSILQVNPGAPGWQNKLVRDIRRLVEEFGFEGVFLDLAAQINNDAKYRIYDGVAGAVRRIREGHPELLIAGEGWFDAMSAVIPLFQSGADDREMFWHDVPHAPFFNAYNRQFGHLCLGDPGKGSVGVHEFGRHPVRDVPLREGILPTVTIVEDTLVRAPDAVEAIIEQAKAYARGNLTRREARN